MGIWCSSWRRLLLEPYTYHLTTHSLPCSISTSCIAGFTTCFSFTAVLYFFSFILGSTAVRCGRFSCCNHIFSVDSYGLIAIYVHEDDSIKGSIGTLFGIMYCLVTLCTPYRSDVCLRKVRCRQFVIFPSASDAIAANWGQFKNAWSHSLDVGSCSTLLSKWRL